MSRLIPRLFILVGLLVVLALGAGVASSASPSITLCPDPVAPGGTVSVMGSGFAPGAVDISLDLTAFGVGVTSVGTATAAADGSFLFPLSILASTASGSVIPATATDSAGASASGSFTVVTGAETECATAKLPTVKVWPWRDIGDPTCDYCPNGYPDGWKWMDPPGQVATWLADSPWDANKWGGAAYALAPVKADGTLGSFIAGGYIGDVTEVALADGTYNIHLYGGGFPDDAQLFKDYVVTNTPWEVVLSGLDPATEYFYGMDPCECIADTSPYGCKWAFSLYFGSLHTGEFCHLGPWSRLFQVSTGEDQTIVVWQGNVNVYDPKFDRWTGDIVLYGLKYYSPF